MNKKDIKKVNKDWKLHFKIDNDYKAYKALSRWLNKPKKPYKKIIKNILKDEKQV